MFAYIIRRILQMIPILFGVALLTFTLFTLFGEDPVRMALGKHATPQSIIQLTHKWKLDLPIHEQFFEFLKQIVTFDYGESFSTGENLMTILKQGALVSFALTAPPFFVGTLINLFLALIIAYKRNSWLDRFSRALFIVSMSISYLVYIIVFQYVLGYLLEVFPIQGFESGVAGIQYLLLPWIIMVVVDTGPDIRLYRAIYLDEMKADYIRTARAKGCREERVLFVHVCKNALIPVLTNFVIAIPFLITGAFVMEKYFSIPGIGDLTVTSINEGDFPIIKSTTILGAILFSVFNLITDLLYALVDPRVKLS